MQSTADPREAIPLLLRRQPRWCTWTLRGRAKVPDQSTRDLSRCRSFETVRKAQGLGFVTTGRLTDAKGRLVLWIDVDACRHPTTGAIASWAWKIIFLLGHSYTEVSPSGTGLRIVVLATGWTPGLQTTALMPEVAPDGVDKRAQVQVFGTGPAGYVTMTGQHLEGTSMNVEVVDLTQFIEYANLRYKPVVPVLPVGDGEPPSRAVIREAVLQDPRGRALADAQWEEVTPGKSASDAYFVLAQLALAGAQGHGEAAADYLLNDTAWGQGLVHGSKDAAKYTRSQWVCAEVARVASKTLAAYTPQRVFEPVLNSTTPPPSTPPATGVIGKRWGGVDAAVFEVAPPPRRFLLRWPIDQGAAGFAPLGVAAFLAAEGGVGKTNLLLQLACSVITGRPWLGFSVDAEHARKRVLLVLGEEDQDEVDRRLHAVGQVMQLGLDDRALIADKLIVLPLAGEVCQLARLHPSEGVPVLTSVYAELERRLHDTPEDEWSLVCLDPLARLYPMAESDNQLATFAVQCIERLTRAPGRPLVMCAHHSSKFARRAGTVDARGVSGLTDGARWVLMMRQLENGLVEFKQAKANYGPPMLEPLMLQRDHAGLLSPVTQEDQERFEREQTDADIAAVAKDAQKLVIALRKEGVPARSQTGLATLAGVRKARIGPAVEYAIQRGWIVHTPGNRGADRGYSLPETPSKNPREEYPELFE